MIYKALALQTACYAINPLKTRNEVTFAFNNAIERISAQIAASIAFLGKDVRLVVTLYFCPPKL